MIPCSYDRESPCEDCGRCTRRFKYDSEFSEMKSEPIWEADKNVRCEVDPDSNWDI
jgi:hypothetical protein